MSDKTEYETAIEEFERADTAYQALQQWVESGAFLEEMFKLADSVIHGRKPMFNMKLLEEEPSCRVYLTLKNYNKHTGLSARVHA